MEIERKFLVNMKNLPAGLERFPHKKFTQGYLCTDPVLRVRREGDDFFVTYKGAGLMAREEYNLPLTEEAFTHLLKKADGTIISKTRYFLPEENGLTIELDFFDEPLLPLVIAEVEFSSMEEARAYTPPSWFAKEVTDDGSFHNSTLSRNGLPPDVSYL